MKKERGGARWLGRWAALSSAAAIASVAAFVLASSAGPRSGSGFAAELHSVGALTSSNAWAVGESFPNASDVGDYRTATEHLQAGTWHKVNAAEPSAYKAQLSGVAAVSPTNVWAALCL